MGERRHFDPKVIRKALERERDELLAVRESSADDRRPVEGVSYDTLTGAERPAAEPLPPPELL